METVVCDTCGTPTPMLSTKRCDACWEVEQRLPAYVKKSPKACAFVLGVLGLTFERDCVVAFLFQKVGDLKAQAEAEEGCGDLESANATDACWRTLEGIAHEIRNGRHMIAAYATRPHTDDS